MKPTTDTSTLKKNPAYLEFPADILNNETFMQMNMSQRGVYWTMRMYCWKNGTIPASVDELSKLLRMSASTLSKLMEDGKIDSFFTHMEEDMRRLFSRDLEAYRQDLLDKKKLKAENGKRGAEKRWGGAENSKTIADEMGSDMNRTDYDPDDGMNGYLTRSLN
jgi:hypothetical protein